MTKRICKHKDLLEIQPTHQLCDVRCDCNNQCKFPDKTKTFICKQCGKQLFLFEGKYIENWDSR